MFDIVKGVDVSSLWSTESSHDSIESNQRQPGVGRCPVAGVGDSPGGLACGRRYHRMLSGLCRVVTVAGGSGAGVTFTNVGDPLTCTGGTTPTTVPTAPTGTRTLPSTFRWTSTGPPATPNTGGVGLKDRLHLPPWRPAVRTLQP